MTTWAAGVDGCPAGWFFVAIEASGRYRHGVAQSFERVMEALAPSDPVLVDIPIGLPGAGLQARDCDVEARRAIAPRGSTVFPAPSRAALVRGIGERGGVAHGADLDVWDGGPRAGLGIEVADGARQPHVLHV